MFTLNCKGRLLVIDKPILMGIINVTPDSFYSESRSEQAKDCVKKAEQMLAAGATLLDLGGQSTRPGSEAISASAEMDRVVPAIEAIIEAFPEALISVDTYYAAVAEAAVRAGASLVNDISGGRLDDAMIATVAKLRVPYIAMHSKGTPQTMQQYATYQNIGLEVLDYFIQLIEVCRLAGIHDVVVDPGFGFAKTIDQNFELLGKLQTLKLLQKPLLAGLSRKSTVYKTLGITANNALNGSTVLHTIALLNGANILRVHDVQQAMEAVTLIERYVINSGDQQ